MGSPVDDDLGAQDLLAVGNLVHNDVAGAPVQHAAVRAVQVNQSLKVRSVVCTLPGSPDMIVAEKLPAKWSITIAPFNGFV
jgi:hypothetical protein